MNRRAKVAATPAVYEPSLVTQMFVTEKYSLCLNIAQLAQVLGITAGTVLNRISANTFGIPIYLDNGKRFTDYRNVAAHFDNIRHFRNRY